MSDIVKPAEPCEILPVAPPTDILLPSKPNEVLPKEVSKEILPPDEIRSDLETSKKNATELYNKANIILDDVLNVAKETQAPRSIEVAATFIKTLSELNAQILDSDLKAKRLKEELKPGPENQVNTQNVNNVFVGSPKELLEVLRNDRIGE